MSAAGNCYDNAFMESCFGTLKTELQPVDSQTEANTRRESSEHMRYDNYERLHSSLGNHTPAAFEQAATNANPETHPTS